MNEKVELSTLERYYAMVQTKGLHCSLMAICIHAIIILVYPILLIVVAYDLGLAGPFYHDVIRIK